MNPNPATGEPNAHFWTSRVFALGSLLVANIITIIFFVVYGGSILQVLWIYWLQSVIIGAVNVVRILKLNFDFKDVTVTGMPAAPAHTPAMKNTIRFFMACFFMFHYGGFHCVYMVFLVVFSMGGPITINGIESYISLGSVSILAVIASGIGFAVHHTLSFVDERLAEQQNPHKAVASVGSAMIRPYLRILPMHLIIITGPFIALKFGAIQVFVVFMILKTIADVRLYQSGTSHKAVPVTVSLPTVSH